MTPLAIVKLKRWPKGGNAERYPDLYGEFFESYVCPLCGGHFGGQWFCNDDVRECPHCHRDVHRPSEFARALAELEAK